MSFIGVDGGLISMIAVESDASPLVCRYCDGRTPSRRLPKSRGQSGNADLASKLRRWHFRRDRYQTANPKRPQGS